MFRPIASVSDQHPTEAAILSSALNLFMLVGEDQVSVTRLIQTAAISRSVFYHYFSSKDDVYAALLLNDELGLSPLFRQCRENPELGIAHLMREFLNYRMQSIDNYGLFLRLESHLNSVDCQLERFQQWQRLRHNHVELFTELARQQWGVESHQDDDDLRYLYTLVWLLADGMVSLRNNPMYLELVQDRRGFKRFLTRLAELAGTRGPL
ncbi:TetR/AcrR family transcriptional regulator [Saccharospirillum impatiens]|uniref:TetR/AcrR family transcriptional regulator n=1 Tax=Saccharospirillum impatiens TaxID=169438 RepID=UPI00040BBADB|nr:TetR/AcrR family transcriptional regulator [Saccharospirillum impatiens]